jgi:hypothetical protein
MMPSENKSKQTIKRDSNVMSTVQEDDLALAEKGVAVEEAPAPAVEAASEAKPSKTTSRRKIWIGVGVMVILAIIGLTVGLVVSSQKQKNDASGSSLTGNDNEDDMTQPSPTPPPTDPTDGTTAVPPTTSPTKSPVDSSTISPTTNTPTVPPPTTSGTPTAEETQFYESTSGIFNVTLPLFSSSVALGYSDETELERDLTEAVKFKVNRIVEQPWYYAQRPGDDILEGEDQAAADTSAGASPPGSSPVAGDVNDFETNTVEESIDEGDLVKTNGVFAFAAYGSYVIVWDVKTGEQVTNITLPSLSYNGQQPPKEPFDVVDPDDLIDFGDLGNGGDGGGRKKRKLQIADEYYYWPQDPNVQSLLLHEDRLVVISSGFGQFVRSNLDYVPALQDAFNTNVRVYDISQLSTTGELPLVHETNVHGSFNSIRSDENKVHLVTFSGLNTWSYIEQPLVRSQTAFYELDDEEYLAAARKLAEDELIPKFVSRLMKDISSSGKPANIARVSLWQKHLSNDTRNEDLVFGPGVFNSYAQVTSFDMMDTSESLQMTEAGMFMPTAWGHTYATNKMLVIVGQGWDWIAEMNGSLQTSYLHGFALHDDGSAIPAAVGSLDGSILNEYSVDVVGNHMRVAVTIRNDFWIFPLIDDVGISDAVAPPAPRTRNHIVVLEIPELDDVTDTDADSAIMKEVGRTENLGKDGEVFTSVRFSDEVAYAVTFERTDPFYVISFEDAVAPKVLGELNITGFSSYLHFINDENTFLLGVGQEADNDGRTLGLQVTLYDATDATNPTNISRYAVELDEDVYSYSNAEWDFKSFRYVKLDNENGAHVGILIIPLRIDLLQIAEQLIFCCANIIRESRKMREAKSLLRAKP